MASSWPALLPLKTLKEYPELLLPISCSLFLFFFFFHRINRRRILPVDWPFIGMLPAISANIHRLQDYITGFLRESGGTFVFRGPWFLGFNYLITCDPANANHILNHHFANYPKGDGFSDIFDILGTGIINSDGDWWRYQRRVGHALLSDRRFRSYVTKCSQDKVENGLVPFLDHLAGTGKAFDLQDVFMRFTFDTTCTLVLGVDPGCLDVDFPSVPLAKAIEDAEHAMTFRYTVPKVWWRLLRWLNMGEEKELARAWEIIDRSLAQTIENRREERKTRNPNDHNEGEAAPADLLTSYMDLQVEAGESAAKSDKFLRDTVLTFLAAGRTTTGAALSWFFWLVSKNPNVEAKILQELRAAKFDGYDTGKLVYLHAALFEALRLYPSVPFNHKAVSEPDVLPSGHKVDRGTTIVITMYPMGRMETVWGKDCGEFKPERWITEDGKLRQVPSYKFLTFNSGPKSCLGKDMALSQMKVVAAVVMFNFQFEVAKGQEVEPAFSIVLTMKNELMVNVRKRSTVGC